MLDDDDDEIDTEQLVLGDLLNHVLDKGVVISGTVTVSIANIDLLLVDELGRLVLSEWIRNFTNRSGITNISKCSSARTHMSKSGSCR